jgi:hypothetical protein
LVAVKLDVVYVLFPLSNAVPPVDASYQSITEPDEEAESATVPVPQREPAVTDGLAGTVFIVAVTAVRAADRQLVVLLRACA